MRFIDIQTPFLLATLALPTIAQGAPLPEAYEVVILTDLFGGASAVPITTLNEAGQTGGVGYGSEGAGLGFFDGERFHTYQALGLLTGQPPSIAGLNSRGQLVVNYGQEGPIEASLRLNPDGTQDIIYRPGRNFLIGRVFQSTAIDELGRVIGRATNDSPAPVPGMYRAFLWEEGLLEELPSDNIGGESATTTASFISPNGRYIAGEHINEGSGGSILVWDSTDTSGPRVIPDAQNIYGVSNEGLSLIGEPDGETLALEDRDGHRTILPPLDDEDRYCNYVGGPSGTLMGPQGWVLVDCKSPALRASPSEGYFLEDHILNPPEGLSLESVIDINGRGQVLAAYAARNDDGTIAEYLGVRLDPVGLEPVTGACRLPTESCILFTPEACDHWEGEFSGIGTSCLSSKLNP